MHWNHRNQKMNPCHLLVLLLRRCHPSNVSDAHVSRCYFDIVVVVFVMICDGVDDDDAVCCSTIDVAIAIAVPVVVAVAIVAVVCVVVAAIGTDWMS